MTCLGLPDCGSENQPCRTQPSTDGCRTASGVSGSSPKPGPSSRSWRGRGATEKHISQPQNMACGSQLRPSSPLGTQLIGERFSLKDGLLTQLETPNAGAASLPGLPDTTFSPCMNQSPRATHAQGPQRRVALSRQKGRPLPSMECPGGLSQVRLGWGAAPQTWTPSSSNTEGAPGGKSWVQSLGQEDAL